jgi:hypothetical protein
MDKNTINIKMNKFTKIVLVTTIILTFFVTFTGFFEVFLSYHFTLFLDSIHLPVPLYLSSGILMVGISIGLISTLVENGKLWSHISIMVVLIGLGIISLLLGYTHPNKIESWIHITSLGSFFVEYLSLLISNIIIALISLLSGLTIIGPYIELSNFIFIIVTWLSSLITFYGYKGALIFFGMLHIYPETFAAVLVCLAGIRVSLESFKAFMHIRRNGFLNSMVMIKKVIIHEFRNTMPKVVALLAIAALLEVLWMPFWINYCLQYVL